MTLQEEAWIKEHCCEFCEGRKTHTCNLYTCEQAVEKAREHISQNISECLYREIIKSFEKCGIVFGNQSERKGNREERVDPKRHKLKAHTDYFLNVCAGKKNFEIREDDRDIQVGDYVQLKEWNPVGGYTGGESRWLHISYVLRDKPEYGLMPGYCIISWDN